MPARKLTPSVILRLAIFGLVGAIAICSWAYELDESWSVLIGVVGLMVVVVTAFFLFHSSVRWSVSIGLIFLFGFLAGWYVFLESFPQPDSIKY